jgi:hypothetical protein
MHAQRLKPGSPIAQLLALACAFAGTAHLSASYAARSASIAGIAVQQTQPAAASCARSWVGREAAVEKALATATIDRLESVPVGVTKPKRAFLAEGSIIASMAWKPLRPGYKGGYYESYKAEIAAYELDKLLNMHMVPPAVERDIEGETGAAIMWLDGVKGWNMKQPVRGPEPEWSRQISRMKMFDQLIGNIDRNQGNILYDDDWHMLLIDHSRAFTDRTKLSGIAPVQGVEETLWGRMNTLTREDLDRALGPWLDDRAINAILVRRDAMREHIKKNVAKMGEARVFLR